MKKVLIYVTLLLMACGGLGCAALSEFVTPAPINDKGVVYVEEAGVADANEFSGYPNLAKARKLAQAIKAAYEVNVLALKQLTEKNDLDYGILNDAATQSIAIGESRQELLFGETGILPLALGLLGFGGFTGVLGLYKKRPGDITSADMEQALADATGKTTEELSTKERQMVQLVKGVQQFMDTWAEKDPEAVTAMKDAFDKTQDTDTQVAVASIKKQI